MHEYLRNKIANSELLQRLIYTPSPQWVILMLDMLIVALSCTITFTFSPVHGSEPNLHWLASPASITVVILFIYLITSKLMHSSEYIVRMSMIVDLYRLTLMVSMASVELVVLSLAVNAATGLLYIRVWNIFIVGMMSFTMMMVMRLVVKFAYARVISTNRLRERVIVLGSNINSFAIANALRSEENGRFFPVALLSLTNIGDHKIDNLPIVPFDQNKVKEVFEKYRCSTLIFLPNQQEFVRTVLANVLLDNNIKLLLLNQVEEIEMKVDEDSPRLSPHVRPIDIEDLLGREQIKTDNMRIHELIAGQVVMITGAAGSIGSEIVRQVARLKACDIVLVDQAETPMHDMQLEMEATFPDIRIHLFVGDVTNPVRMERAFVKYRPRYVFHAAAYKHVPMMERNPTEAILTNVFGTKNIADLSVKYGVEKFVMISTDKAVNPTNIMGASKRIAEIYVQSLFFLRRQYHDGSTTQFITTRFGNVLGSNGSVIPLFRRQIEAGGPVTVTHRDVRRYFMTIPEACSLVLEAGCMGRGGEIYIFDMGKSVKIYDLACRMISLAGLRVGEDIKIVETGLRPGEKLYEELLNDKERTIPTHHKKIMVAKVRTYDYIDVMNHLTVLREAIDTCDTHRLVAEMKHIVPEYHSQNSKYEAIDREILEEDAPDILTEDKPATA